MTEGDDRGGIRFVDKRVSTRGMARSRSDVNQVTSGFEQNHSDSPGSPPIHDKLEHPMPIRYLESFLVQPRSFSRARDHLAGEGDGRSDVRV